MNKKIAVSMMVGALGLGLGVETAMASCSSVSWANLQNTANSVVQAGGSGGYGLNMWVSFVDETGKVCAVVNTASGSGARSGSSWLGSRVISAQKANTANAFSLNGYAISTANLYQPAQSDNSLFGLQFSNPVDPAKAYAGSPSKYGSRHDPLVNKRVGGVNVFGGGLALYIGGVKVGAIGVSGDTSCTDHAVAWKIRAALGAAPGGVGITTSNFTALSDSTKAVAINGVSALGNTTNSFSLKGDEMIILDSTGSDDNQTVDENWAGWQHPKCPNTPVGSATGSGANGIVLVKQLPPT